MNENLTLCQLQTCEINSLFCSLRTSELIKFFQTSGVQHLSTNLGELVVVSLISRFLPLYRQRVTVSPILANPLDYLRNDCGRLDFSTNLVGRFTLFGIRASFPGFCISFIFSFDFSISTPRFAILIVGLVIGWQGFYQRIWRSFHLIS